MNASMNADDAPPPKGRSQDRPATPPEPGPDKSIAKETDYERVLAQYSDTYSRRSGERDTVILSPLSAAICAKDEESTVVLLNGGANPNEVDTMGKNALHRAAETGCGPRVFRRILERIDDVNASDVVGRTALMFAAMHNQMDILISLMNTADCHGLPRIDLNAQDGMHHYTALHHAVERNHSRIVEQLLLGNVDLSIVANWGTPLKFARKYERHEIEKMLSEKEKENHQVMGVENEGIDGILAVMAQHRDSTEVQYKGCYILGNVAFNGANCRTIAEKGGIDVILAGMKQHPDSTEVQQKGCYALARVNGRTIAEKGGIDVILAGMKQHPGSTGVQENGCYALGMVAAGNDANQRTIAEKGGIEAAFRAMTQHSHDEGVQRRGCGVMWHMVRCESVRPAIREGKAVMDAARNNFPNNGNIQYCLNIVCRMCNDELALRSEQMNRGSRFGDRRGGYDDCGSGFGRGRGFSDRRGGYGRSYDDDSSSRGRTDDQT